MPPLFRYGLAVAASLCAPHALRAEEPLAVRTIAVALTPDPLVLTLSGTIEASSTTNASFRTGGRVLAVRVAVGDLVKEGQELAHLDPTQQIEALRVAQAALDAAEANLANAAQTYTRSEALRASGTLTEAQLDAANEARISAGAARDGARSDLEKARQALEDTRLYAPRDAIVTARGVEPGQVVGAAQSVLTLADPERREASFLAPEHLDLDRLMGTPVQLHLIDTPSQSYSGEISEVSPIVDPNLGAVRLRARILPVEGSPPAPLGEGIRGTAPLGEAAGIALPWQAITKTVEGPAVWRITPDHRVELVGVQIERFTSNTVVVTPENLAAEDLIVTEGAHRLYPNRPVTALTGDAK